MNQRKGRIKLAAAQAIQDSGFRPKTVGQGRYDDAQNLFAGAIEIGKRELPGKGHPWALRNVNGLALLRTRQKQYEEAECLFHEALERRKLKLGEVPAG